MPKFSIMQGRLSPPQNGQLQFFPKEWEKEFPLAKQLGFDCIEWVFNSKHGNPMYHPGSSPLILALMANHEMPVSSICADYFMRNSLTNSTEKYSMVDLAQLIFAAWNNHIKIINIPLLENSAIKNQTDRLKIIDNLDPFDELLKALDTHLALEVELPGKELKGFISAIDSPQIGVCYDTGNCITFGHDLPGDIRLLGKMIKEVHLKDRKIGSTQSVYFGTGDVDFEACFRAFHDIGFDSPFVLQAWREEDYLDDAKRQLEFVKKICKKTGG